MSCYNEAIDRLRLAGFRLTPQRAMVLEAIYHNDGHLTAEEIHTRVQIDSPYVDLSTIYRTLQFLKGNVLIGELRLEGEPARYEALRSGQEHHHAICTECDAMLEIDPVDLESLIHTLLQRYSFQVNPVHMTIPGLCAECAAQAAQPNVP